MPPTEIIKSTAKSRAALAHQETIIDDGLRQMQNVGKALTTIRDEKLWIGEYDSFEHYCIQKWKIKKSRAQQLISGAKFVEDLTAFVKDEKPLGLTEETVKDIPLCEGHIRALMDNADGLESQVELLAESVKVAGTHGLTERVIKRTATALYGEKPADQTKSRKKKATPVTATEPTPEEASEPPAEPSQFNPDELEGIAKPDDEKSPPIKTPLHCLPIIEGTKKVKDIRNRLIQLKKDLRAVCESSAGSWFNAQEADRLIDQLFVEVKFRMYECPCPRCKVKINEKCERCGGRGWLDAGHANQNTDADKAWLEKIA